MQDFFLNYGLTGAIILALGMYVLKLEDRHRKERKEWQEQQDKQFDRLNEISDSTNHAMRENTNILSGLKTLLENQNRR
jgi:hypothetical protein